MAAKKNYLYFGSEKVSPVSTEFEFDESDIWNSTQVVSTEPRRSFFGARAPKKPMKRNDHDKDVSSKSLPVNVPDWSKILGSEYKNRTVEIDDHGIDDEGDERVPPHEYLARTRGASGSVQEGAGRTLKGRDMRMVRNAIWKQTGFED
ncbi:Senescence regulator [Heracleum sosnowskyi]|uniref:Senescence regulator n=1 Tax=Heracleum sosnowskyi TaxID=360622 RepID=A0AAD8JH74_9APIA|nr:Senescence regulator [Heracleum sosnowskyi]